MNNIMMKKISVLLVGTCLLSTAANARILKAARGVALPHVSPPTLVQRITGKIRHKLFGTDELSIEFSRLDALTASYRAKCLRQDSKTLKTEKYVLRRVENRLGSEDGFSLDGVNWFEMDRYTRIMLERARADNRPLRLVRSEDGLPYAINISLYESGPEFEFYDEDLFKELDKSKELGLELVEDKENKDVEVRFPAEFENTRVVMADENGQPVTLSLKELHDRAPWRVSTKDKEKWELSYYDNPIFKINQAVVVETLSMLNTWYAGVKKVAEIIKPYEGKVDLRVVGQADGPEATFWISDSKGNLYRPEDVSAAVKAELATR